MIVLDKDQLVDNPLVTVQVYAYNKEKYIRECLDSVLSQEVNFEYEVIISENPGTDNTRNICIEYQKKYPKNVILVLREKNMGFFCNYYEAEKMSRGKYIARCDADDFWCDTRKLQKQVDFMESHPDYGCCYTRSRIFIDETQKYQENLGGRPWKGFKSDLLCESIQQPSVMYRRDLFKKYYEEIRPDQRNWLMEDTPRTYWFACNSKIARLDDITAVYRIVNNSLSHQVDYEKSEKYHRSILDIRLFYYDKYCPGETDLLVPLHNDYYRRNIDAAYAAKNFKELLDNVCHYKHTTIKEINRHILIICKLVIKKIFRMR